MDAHADNLSRSLLDHVNTHTHTDGVLFALLPANTHTQTHTGTLPPVGLSIASNNVLIKSAISCLRGMKLDMMSVAH